MDVYNPNWGWESECNILSFASYACAVCVCEYEGRSSRCVCVSMSQPVSLQNVRRCVTRMSMGDEAADVCA